MKAKLSNHTSSFSQEGQPPCCPLQSIGNTEVAPPRIISAKPFFSALAVFIALHLLPVSAQACSVCFAGADTPIGKAANGAIIVMLLLIGSVLSCFIYFMFHLARQSRKAALIAAIDGTDRVSATTSHSSQELH